MKFTGERLILEGANPSMLKEHMERYLFAKRFVKGKKVLDLACGTGYGTNILSETAKSIYGGDISKETILSAKKSFKNKKIKFEVIDATNMEFPSKYFDVVVSFETIEHLERWDLFVEEVKRVLKPGGLFICSTPNKNITSPFSKKPINPYHFLEFKLNRFKELIYKNFKIKYPFYGQIPVERNSLFKIKSFIFGFTIYYKIIKIIKKVTGYSKKRTISEDYAKVFSLEDLNKNVEPTYIICVAENN
jgi:ubiquinone/menaquinone biosynthesis C-methylase UbiE